ncbi:hypothetical protein LCGC14_2236920 [marine sediment metagenome]|uniref:HK97 gp10 family phage protein n=1 Tax=marine sediment metagenome TaxID=412755 RepID=A0A0F9D6U7_9ZZZZ
MSLASDLDRFANKVKGRTRRIVQIAREEVQRSIVEGSSITGAPGQPVQFGALKGSWVPRFLGPHLWQTSTPLAYGPVIEDLIGRFGAITIRSVVGGGHSVKLTRAGWQGIEDHGDLLAAVYG